MGSPTGKKDVPEAFRFTANVADRLLWVAQTTGRSKTRVVEDALAKEHRRVQEQQRRDRKKP